MRNRALKLSGVAMYEAVVQAVQGGVPPELLPSIPEEYHSQCVAVGGDGCGRAFLVGSCDYLLVTNDDDVTH